MQLIDRLSNKLFLVSIAILVAAFPFMLDVGVRAYSGQGSDFLRLCAGATHELLFIGIALSIAVSLEIAEGNEDLRILGYRGSGLATLSCIGAMVGGIICIVLYFVCIMNAKDFADASEQSVMWWLLSLRTVAATLFMSCVAQMLLNARKSFALGAVHGND